MEVLDELKDMVATRILPEELTQTEWSDGTFEQDDSLNSKDQGLMLDEVREAANDMAQIVSMYSSSSEALEFAGSIQQSEASSEKAPTLIGDESTQNEEREAEEIIIALLQNIEQANTVDDLEKIHERFTVRAQLLKGKIALLKSRELIEAYLSVMATLNAVRKQIDIARQQNTVQINGRLIAEQITIRLSASQQAIRQAAQRMMENAINLAQQNMIMQSQRIQPLLQNSMNQLLVSQQGQQTNLAAERARLSMQELSHKLNQSQQAMRRAEEAMLRARNSGQQQQVIARLNQIMRGINLQSQINIVQQQLQVVLRQAAQQQQAAREAAGREQATRQITATQQLQGQLQQLNVVVQQQQAVQRAFELQQSTQQITQLNAAIERTTQQYYAAFQQQATSQRAANDSLRQSDVSYKLSHDAQRIVDTAAREKYGVENNQVTNSLKELFNGTQQTGKEAAKESNTRETLKESQKTQDITTKTEQAQKQAQEVKAKEEVAKQTERSQKIEQARRIDAAKEDAARAESTRRETQKREKPTGDIAAGGCKKGCPCGTGCNPNVMKMLETLPQKSDVEATLKGKDVKNLSHEEFSKVIASNQVTSTILKTTEAPSTNPSVNGADQAIKNINLNQPLF